MTDEPESNCIACLMLVVVRDELQIVIADERAFGEDLHRIFGRVQERRDAGDKRGGSEEGEILGTQIADASTAAGLTPIQQLTVASRLANLDESGGGRGVNWRFPEYHEPSA